MGVELPVGFGLNVRGLAGGAASPLAVKHARPRAEGEASLCAIKITREAARATNQRQEPRDETDGPVAMAFRGEAIGAAVLNISSRGAMVRCAIDPVIGETLQLSFPGDERIEGVVRWVRDGCIGVEFGAAAGPVAVPSAKEPPPLRQVKLVEPDGPVDAVSDGNRAAKRARVLLAARLETAGGTIDARLRDLSCRGALLECSFPFEVGDAVVFSRGETVVPARIAWATSGRIGLEFDRPIEESEVLVHLNRESPPPLQERIQAHELALANSQATFRRPSFSDRLSDYDRKLARVIGSSLGIGLIDE